MSERLKNAYGIIPSSGEFVDSENVGTWPVNFNLPQGTSGEFSSGGWTLDNVPSGNFGNEGFIQQTFLGASITSFNINAGFGDSVSTLSVSLVNDEFNYSDGTPEGYGDDPYHSGYWIERNGADLAERNQRNGGNKETTLGGDFFRPPMVGTPVYFKFGKNPASVEQAYRQTYDDLYKLRTLPKKDPRSKNSYGVLFPQEKYDKNAFDELPSYYAVDLVDNIIEDRSALWDEDTFWRGRNHFVFGGILQSYTENKGANGAPLYSVNVTDPREILSNVDVLLNNYQDTTYNYKNLINLYGFLEYDPSAELLSELEKKKRASGIVKKISVPESGVIQYRGIRANWDEATGWETPDLTGADTINVNPYLAIVDTDELEWEIPTEGVQSVKSKKVELLDQYYFGKSAFSGLTSLPEYFPITGQGFSRRSDKGIPFYRVSQGLAAIFQYYGFLPRTPSESKSEYEKAGFGGQINFRGYNYVVDFGGIPTEKIPLLYYMDFDKIDLLSLAQELCDIISHELYVTLLPVIDHPSSQFLYNYNQYQIEENQPEKMIHGIIRLDAIDKSSQPKYGAIDSYLDNLAKRGIEVENQDVGYELSNVTTDKFVVGAQEVDMYLFSTNRDRDELSKAEGNNNNLEKINQKQWDIPFQLQQQVIPYYGLLGDEAVTIPRGFGSYQQILLDARNLNANGVGNYYVATELELRAALVSYKAWKNFLLSYNDVYIEDISEHSAFFSALSAENNQINRLMQDFFEGTRFNDLPESAGKRKIADYLKLLENRQYAVTVPRCVFHSDRPFMVESGEGGGGYPASPCSPPLGYPLYYKRATRIGIVEAGVGKVVDAKTRVVTGKEQLKKELESKSSPLLQFPSSGRKARLAKLQRKLTERNKQADEDPSIKKTKEYQNLVKAVEEAKQAEDVWETMGSTAPDLFAEIEDLSDPDKGPMARFLANIEKTAKKHEENAKKVYEFVKKVADECLGKKFLVRLPKSTNVFYSKIITRHEDLLPNDDGEINQAKDNFKEGPFGFPPRPLDNRQYYTALPEWTLTLQNYKVRGYIEDKDSLVNKFLADYYDPLNPYSPKIKTSEVFDQGAIKGNYNPFSERWEFNYKPEPQGGYLSYENYGANFNPLDYLKEDEQGRRRLNFSDLPPAIRQGLLPVDPTNITSDNGRLQCYVKYNNSQTLDFTGVNAGDMVQQDADIAGDFITDVIEELPNNSFDKEESFDSIENIKKDQRLLEKQKDTVAFVKCQIEEKLYLPPKTQKYNLDVFANEYQLNIAVPSPKLVNTQGFTEDCKRIKTLEYPKITPVFSVPPDGGVDGKNVPWIDFKRRFDKTLKGWIIETEPEQLDDEHIYALVTIPGRIKSNVDVRWKDGPMQAYNTVEQKHLMMQDTVQIPEFSKPNIPVPSRTQLPCGDPPIFPITANLVTDGPDKFFNNVRDARQSGIAAASGYGLIADAWLRPTTQEWENHEKGGGKLPTYGWSPGREEDWIRLSLEEVSSARRTTKAVLKGFALDQPVIKLGFTSPSPVYPDLFVLPLMSMERCYGPWLSSTSLDPNNPVVRYSNIGGKVEFAKDENLAPWNFAGYQLMNDAGSLQANFSNSLLLFSERGGFVMPDAPTGIALAKALKEEGPLVTSITIDVGDNGVKTTVKMDLYTSSFGKLAKQKEMAIGQVARERQKSLDQKNNAIRRGLGKSQTSSDLVDQVMQGGGNYMMGLVNSINSQQEAFKEQGQEISEQVTIVGPNGNTQTISAEDLQRKMEVMDPASLRGASNNTAILPTAFGMKSYHNNPTQGMVSKDVNQNRAMADRTNAANRRQQ